MSGHWASADSLYGSSSGTPSYSGQPAPTAAMATDDVASGWKALIDPHNPLLWIGGIIAVTVGFAGFASSARAGKARVSLKVGDD